jgi:hypothetical protein
MSGVPVFRIPEDDQLGRPQRESDKIRFRPLINSSEGLDAFGVQQTNQAIGRIRYGMLAFDS